MMNWIIAGLTFVVTSLGALGLHELDIAHIKKQDAANQVAAVAQEASLCVQSKTVTTEVDNALIKSTDLTNSLADNAVGVLNAKGCSGNLPGSSSGNNGSAAPTRLYYSDPAAARSLLNRVKVCQLQVDKLVGLQLYVTELKKILDQQQNNCTCD